MRKKGFTLIEMLVVIAVIGVLAVVLFVAIDPFEQTNKARDGGKVSTAKEIIDAAERFYVTFEYDPGNSDGFGGCDTPDLVTAGELKNLDYTDLTLICNGSGSYSIQFTPDSKAYTVKCANDANGEGADCLVPEEFEN